MSLRSRITFCPTLLAQYVWDYSQTSADDGYAGHDGDNLPEQVDVGTACGWEQGRVEHDLDEQRVHHAQTGRDENQEPDQQHPVPVGCKKGDDPPKWPALREVLCRWGNVKRRFVLVGIVRSLAGDRRGWRPGVAA